MVKDLVDIVIATAIIRVEFRGEQNIMETLPALADWRPGTVLLFFASAGSAQSLSFSVSRFLWGEIIKNANQRRLRNSSPNGATIISRRRSGYYRNT